eukprot:COSAG02_NODE_34605_length_481_cov_1.005236_1_plen_66_part_01
MLLLVLPGRVLAVVRFELVVRLASSSSAVKFPESRAEKSARQQLCRALHHTPTNTNVASADTSGTL